MRTRVLNSQIWVPQKREDVFPFFADVQNLDQITPSWLHFRIVTPGAQVGKGALLQYRLRIRGIPINWLTEITVWEPPIRFVDEQRKGPYSQWIHEHRFMQDSGGTTILDHVEYKVPGWIFEPWVYHLLVGPDVDKIFAFRREWLKKHFGTTGLNPAPSEPCPSR